MQYTVLEWANNNGHFGFAGADGVMSSEAILENPAIFSSHAEEKTMPTQLQLAREYLVSITNFVYNRDIDIYAGNAYS